MIVKGFEETGVIKVDNVRVYGLEESIVASGYPMQISTIEMADNSPVTNLAIEDRDYKRMSKLGNAKPGSGHDCACKGITVQFDLQVSEYIWRQLDRYHFIDYVSSQSKMHRILKLDIDKACNKYVSQHSVTHLNCFIDMYNNSDIYKAPNGLLLRDKTTIELTKENIFKLIIANTPSGIMLTARMTTNYLQLKSMYNQRHNHKMEEWRLFTEWFKTLPYFEKFVLSKGE